MFGSSKSKSSSSSYDGKDKRGRSKSPPLEPANENAQPGGRASRRATRRVSDTTTAELYMNADKLRAHLLLAGPLDPGQQEALLEGLDSATTPERFQDVIGEFEDAFINLRLPMSLDSKKVDLEQAMKDMTREVILVNGQILNFDGPDVATDLDQTNTGAVEATVDGNAAADEEEQGRGVEATSATGAANAVAMSFVMQVEVEARCHLAIDGHGDTADRGGGGGGGGDDGDGGDGYSGDGGVNGAGGDAGGDSGGDTKDDGWYPGKYMGVMGQAVLDAAAGDSARDERSAAADAAPEDTVESVQRAQVNVRQSSYQRKAVVWKVLEKQIRQFTAPANATAGGEKGGERPLTEEEVKVRWVGWQESGAECMQVLHGSGSGVELGSRSEIRGRR